MFDLRRRLAYHKLLIALNQPKLAQDGLEKQNELQVLPYITRHFLRKKIETNERIALLQEKINLESEGLKRVKLGIKHKMYQQVLKHYTVLLDQINRLCFNIAEEVPNNTDAPITKKPRLRHHAGNMHHPISPSIDHPSADEEKTSPSSVASLL